MVYIRGKPFQERETEMKCIENITIHLFVQYNVNSTILILLSQAFTVSVFIFSQIVCENRNGYVTLHTTTHMHLYGKMKNRKNQRMT